MGLPKFLQPYLPSYDISSLPGNDTAVAREIITQVLNLGDEKAVTWIFKTYTLGKIKSAVKNPQRGVWGEESLNYWRQILKVGKIKNYETALQKIYP